MKSWMYRHSGKNLWACEFEGHHGHASLTLVDCGQTAIPGGLSNAEIVEVRDADIAHYFLEELSRWTGFLPG